MKQGGLLRLVLRSRKYRRLNVQYTVGHRAGKRGGPQTGANEAVSIEGSMSNILEAIGQGNKEVLKDWCYEAVSIEGSMSSILEVIGQGNEEVLKDWCYEALSIEGSMSNIWRP